MCRGPPANALSSPELLLFTPILRGVFHWRFILKSASLGHSPWKIRAHWHMLFKCAEVSGKRLTDLSTLLYWVWAQRRTLSKPAEHNRPPVHWIQARRCNAATIGLVSEAIFCPYCSFVLFVLLCCADFFSVFQRKIILCLPVLSINWHLKSVSDPPLEPPTPTSHLAHSHPCSPADVDECLTDTHSCRPSEHCVNTVGSFVCEPQVTCPAGYQPRNSVCEGEFVEPEVFPRANLPSSHWQRH